MRIRTTTGPGASPHPMSITTAIDNKVQSDHGWAPSPPATVSMTGLLPGGAAVLVSGRPQVTPGGLGADVAPDATNTIPLAAPRQATTDGEVSA
jgi:hypothetical protein